MALVGLDTVKRLIVARRPRWVDGAILAAGLLFATVLREAVDGGFYGFPFLTFFPLILLTSVFLGGGYAIVAALASAVIVGRLFLPRPWMDNPESGHAVILLLYAITTFFVIATGHVMRLLVRENEAHMCQQDAFNAELQHRTKNALQIMRALIARGPRGEDPTTYFATLAGRLDALAKANELLRFGVLEFASLHDLVNAAIGPFDTARFTIEGPSCRVSREAATPLMMALHELGTNATKYGALSNDAGRVSLRWTVAAGAQPLVVLEWDEEGGPPIMPPRHRGLGTRLLTAHGGLAAVDMDWRREGLLCRMKVNGA